MVVWVYLLLTAYIAGVFTVLWALFRGGRRLRAWAAAVGAVAIWMPFIILRTSLGLPSPFTRPGDYQILGSQLDAPAGRMYVLLDVFEGFTAPRLYSLPFKHDQERFDQQFDMERNPYAFLGATVHMDDGGALNVTERPADPPDWDKEEYYGPAAPFAGKARK
jgi:hypothetical protein